jgi:hypothetical protein
MASISTSLLPPGFGGLFAALNPINSWEKPAEDEVRDDCEGETEALLLQEGPNIETTGASQLAQLHGTLMNASKGVTEGTDGKYRTFVLS